MDRTDLTDLRRLNLLWDPIYPYLAEWITEGMLLRPGRFLEVGPFSGGISRALLSLFPDGEAVFVTPEPFVAEALRGDFGPDLESVTGDLERLPFGSFFDLVIFRGAFFFLTPAMILEMDRVLREGGAALVGGGYGPLTPREEIEQIGEESKDLNARLGKKWISRAHLGVMIREAGLEKRCRILAEGGLWLFLRKDVP